MNLRLRLRLIGCVRPSARRAAARRAAEAARLAAIELEQKDIWGMAPGHPESMIRQLSPAEEALVELLIGREWPNDDYVKGNE